VIRAGAGKNIGVEETTNPTGEPAVAHVLDGDTACVTLTGELTEAARRPLVRALTDLLLGERSPSRVLLDLRGVPFMNSAGMAVLVQLQRMAAPRAIDIALLDPPESVRRPLQLSGLWRRFPVRESSAEGGVAPAPEDGAS
jgi:stage II sporulation protein AA (anti-sigma F factor antagonist)